MTTYTLSPPPGVNSLYANVPGLGRRKTRQYRAWVKAALLELMVQRARPVVGCVNVSLSFPKGRHDLDARIKPSLDLLKRAGIIVDDSPKYIGGTSVNFHTDDPLMRIEITPVANQEVAA